MLIDQLTSELVCCKANAVDWRDAIRQAGSLLEDAGKCDASYIGAMVAAVERFGPYMVLEKGIAMPHARAEGNVFEAGICVLTLSKPVCFGNEEFDPVGVLIAICAPDPKGHLTCLSELSVLFENEDTVPQLGACSTSEEILTVIKRIGHIGVCRSDAVRG